jgi:signal transduction histidine kinase
VSRRIPAAVVIAVAAAVAGWLLVDAVRQSQLGVADAGLWFVVGAGWVAVGAALAVGRWPERRRMALLMLWWLVTAVGEDVGVAWPTSRIASTAFLLAVALQPAAFAHMSLAYPTGFVRDRIDRGFLVLAYAIGLLWELPPALFADPRACGTCSPRAPSLLFTGHTADLATTGKVFWGVFIALGLAFIALLARRLYSSPRGALRTMLPLALAGFFACTQLIVVRIAWLTGWTQALTTLDWISRASLLTVPAAIATGVAMIRRRRGALGDFVVELGAAKPGEIRGALARAVGDPSLEVALWLSDQRRYVDEHGETVTVDDRDPDRAVTVVGPPDQPLAALIHDPALAGQGALLEAAGSAARIALENARLNAELQAQLVELRASRARIVAAGEAERRRLERDLHDGAQQRLLAIGLALQLLEANPGEPGLVAEAQRELQAALEELRTLARGLHPAILTERGLRAAVESLVDRATIPVTADVCEQRYPPAVESAAYFVVCEALANVTKHARAESASVAIAPLNGHLIVDVHDDGRGGADPAGGTGLQGLADRVGALDGHLSINTEASGGTTIHAEIPCAS